MALEAGAKLTATLNSILAQDYRDYEVIIKDGGSKDGSVEALYESGILKDRDNVHIFVEKDMGIYDAMNQALSHINGSYVQFLNCGDCYHDEYVLSSLAKELVYHEYPHIIYGDQYNLLQKSKVTSNPKLDEYALFRNVPCHQVCFYDSRLFEKRGYLTKYSVRADYEHFLYCIYEEKAVAKHTDIIVCDYEGGGYSETGPNRKKSALQHREITEHYMGERAGRYRRRILLSGGPIRTALANSSLTAGIYNSIKSRIYGNKGSNDL